MNHFTEVVPVLAWLLVAAVALLVAAVLFGAIRAAAGPGTRKRRRHPRAHAVAMVLGEYAARARERLAATFRDSEYEEYDEDDDDQPRPGGSPLSGPGPSTGDHDDRCIHCGAEVDHYLGCPEDPDPDYEAEAELAAGDLEQEPTDAEELAFLQAIRPDDEPPRVMAAAKVQGTWLPLTGEPNVNPWINPAFSGEVMPVDTRWPAPGRERPLVDVPRPGSGDLFATTPGPGYRQNVPRPRKLRHPEDGLSGQDNGPGHPGFWPMPLAWGQHDVRRTMARDHDDTDIISQPRIVARRDVATRPYGFDHMLRSAPLRQLQAGVW